MLLLQPVAPHPPEERRQGHLTLTHPYSENGGKIPMSYNKKIAIDLVFDPIADLKQVRRFLAEYETDLAHKAVALGGRAASAGVFVFSKAIRASRRLTRAHKRQLVVLHHLLTLQNVGDPYRIETGLFSETDPDSPFVAECRLLADKLEGLLYGISADDDADISDHSNDGLKNVA